MTFIYLAYLRFGKVGAYHAALAFLVGVIWGVVLS
jgi:hypothetical protein